LQGLYRVGNSLPKFDLQAVTTAVRRTAGYSSAKGHLWLHLPFCIFASFALVSGAVNNNGDLAHDKKTGLPCADGQLNCTLGEDYLRGQWMVRSLFSGS